MRMLITTLHATLTSDKTSSLAIAPVAARAAVSTRSPWHSPVPYLFGGLAAMLGLIAFALLILACSYWRLSGDDSQQQSNETRDLESGEKGDGVNKLNGAPIFEEKIVVIMAGNDKPTFLATPSLMLFSNNKDSSNDNDDDHNHDHAHDDDDDHVMVGCINVKDDETKESTTTSVQEEEHDGNDGNDDDDDVKIDENETTHSHN